MKSQSDDKFADQLRDTLRKSEQQLDTPTRTKLAAARREAMQQETRGRRAGFGLPALGSLAAAALIAVMVIRMTGPVTEPATAPAAATDTTADVMTAEQQLELYEHLEMLEFFDELEFADGLADEPAEERAS